MLASFNVYVFALCELGRTEGLEQMIEDYWKVVLDRYDPRRREGAKRRRSSQFSYFSRMRL